MARILSIQCIENMRYQRVYRFDEVKYMLQMYEGNRVNGGAEAHAIRQHAGVGFDQQRTRVNTPGEPRNTSTYWTLDEQAKATMEILNSLNGQTELSNLDRGREEFTLEQKLTPRIYEVAIATDRSIDVLVRNMQNRRVANANSRIEYATHGFIKVIGMTGKQIQIQTSFPIIQDN